MTTRSSVTLLNAQMYPRLPTNELAKKLASNQSFSLIGQYDLGLEPIPDGEEQAVSASRSDASTTPPPRSAESNPAAPTGSHSE